MDKTPPLRELIDSTELLMKNNEQLVKLNTEMFAFFEDNYKRQEKILTCFGKVYQFINAKKDKTWDEHQIVKELFDLITYSKTDDEQEREGK